MKLEFSPKQREVWRESVLARHRWNISCGATRSGKTYLDYFRIPYRLRNAGAGGLLLLLGNTRGTLERNILDPMRRIWGEGLVGRTGSDGRVRLFGREAYALGADRVSQVARLQGAGLAYCYGDEIATWHEDVFQMLKSRLDKPGACFDGTCNPAGPGHWLKTFLDSGADVYRADFTIDDNPFLDPGFVDSLKREYRGTVYYDRYILGRWTVAEGLVYPMFDPALHVDGVPDEPGGLYYISVDYGTVNPCSMGLWRLSGNRAARVAECYYDSRRSRRQRTDEEHYAALEALAGDRVIQSVVVDPSAASFMETIRRHGRFHVRKAVNSVNDGIRLTASLLSAGRLSFHHSCRDSLREFNLYAWDSRSGDDRVMKENDHAMDDIRYFCSTVMKRL